MRFSSLAATSRLLFPLLNGPLLIAILISFQTPNVLNRRESWLMLIGKKAVHCLTLIYQEQKDVQNNSARHYRWGKTNYFSNVSQYLFYLQKSTFSMSRIASQPSSWELGRGKKSDPQSAGTKRDNFSWEKCLVVLHKLLRSQYLSNLPASHKPHTDCSKWVKTERRKSPNSKCIMQMWKNASAQIPHRLITMVCLSFRHHRGLA